MKKLNYTEILERANMLYAAEKTKHIPESDLRYWPPERFPKIESNQVKCMLKAIIEAINSES